MFSKIFLKPASIFLILFISVTSATPTGHPGEAQNINDDSDILAREYKPYLCIDPYIWERRECYRFFGPLAWRDVCAQTLFTQGRDPITYRQDQQGYCPPGTICRDDFNTDGRRFVSCIPDGYDKGKQKTDPQAGTSEAKRARTELGRNTQLEFSLTIDHDMLGAAVDAFVESDDGSFVIAPNNILVGNVHGRNQQVCKGDKSDPGKARECYPNDVYDFKTGDVIDFTWGLSSNQVGKVVYSVTPAAFVS